MFGIDIQTVLWVITLSTVIVAVGLGAILGYHWFRYGLNRTIAMISLAAFSAGSLILLLILITLVSLHTTLVA